MLKHFKPSGSLERIVGSGQNVIREGFPENVGAMVHVEVVRGERGTESAIRGGLVDMSAFAVPLTGREEVVAHREAPVQLFVDIEPDGVFGDIREREHAGLAGLDFRKEDFVSEFDLFVHDVNEAKAEKVGDPETDRDADDEEHMVVIFFTGEEVVADRGDDSLVLYGGGGVAAVFAVIGYPVKGGLFLCGALLRVGRRTGSFVEESLSELLVIDILIPRGDHLRELCIINNCDLFHDIWSFQ